MRAGSRPISTGTTCSVRYAATASSRPFSVASPRPLTPASVSIFSVTKLRPGQVTMTRADLIFKPCSSLLAKLVRPIYHLTISRSNGIVEAEETPGYALSDHLNAEAVSAGGAADPRADRPRRVPAGRPSSAGA